MSRQQKRLPHQIDPFRLVEQRSELSGQVPVSQMKRLAPLVSDDSGQIDVVLNFDVDELGVPHVRGRLVTTVMLICQRCLEPFEFAVDAQVALAWIKTERQAQELPIRYEPYLVETTPLILNDIIEDELLLALPHIPMHDKAVCPATKLLNTQADDDAVVEEEETENPFSVLAKLKDKD